MAEERQELLVPACVEAQREYQSPSDEEGFAFEGQVFSDIQELSDYLQAAADQSAAGIKASAKKLFQDETHLDPALADWLLRLGYAKALENWEKKYGETT